MASFASPTAPDDRHVTSTIRPSCHDRLVEIETGHLSLSLSLSCAVCLLCPLSRDLRSCPEAHVQLQSSNGSRTGGRRVLPASSRGVYLRPRSPRPLRFGCSGRVGVVDVPRTPLARAKGALKREQACEWIAPAFGTVCVMSAVKLAAAVAALAVREASAHGKLTVPTSRNEMGSTSTCSHCSGSGKRGPNRRGPNQVGGCPKLPGFRPNTICF